MSEPHHHPDLPQDPQTQRTRWELWIILVVVAVVVVGSLAWRAIGHHPAGREVMTVPPGTPGGLPVVAPAAARPQPPHLAP